MTLNKYSIWFRVKRGMHIQYTNKAIVVAKNEEEAKEKCYRCLEKEFPGSNDMWEIEDIIQEVA